MKREFSCPFCQALVVGDDTTQVIHHAAPACAKWIPFAEALGGVPLGQTRMPRPDGDGESSGAS